MVEILAVVYGVCFLASTLLVLWQFQTVNQQLKSKSLLILNRNLAKQNLSWSNNESNFASLTAASIQEDGDRLRRNTLMLEIFAFLSVLGLVLVFLVILSIRYLARSQKEKAVFGSALARDSALSSDQVQALINEFKDLR